MAFSANGRVSSVAGFAFFLSLTCVFLAGHSIGQSKTSTTCRSIVLTGTLAAGNHFEKLVGGGLVFRLDPEQLGPRGERNGWRMTLVRRQGNDDYIYPVNPPLRFNGEQILGPSYGDDTKKSLGHPHEMFFLLSSSDYDRIMALATNVLWPHSAPRPEKAAEEYESALRTVRTGRLRFVVMVYDAVRTNGFIRQLKFKAQFVAPAEFGFDASLSPEPIACPKGPQ